MIEAKNIICIYHGNCADGFGAAWSVRQALGDEVEFHAGVYQQTPPDVKGKYVIIVDFSYPPAVLETMLEDAFGILIIDHHKSAYELFQAASLDRPYLFVDMSSWINIVCFDRYKESLIQDDCENCGRTIYGYFDMERSGAMMAWNFFNPNTKAPKLLEHIQDRDLWRFDLPYTREIQAALFSFEYDFKEWDDLMNQSTDLLVQDGLAIERKHFKDIKEFIKKAGQRITIAGHEVPALNAPYFFSSDAGHIMSEGEKFAACYWDEQDKRVYSLRSSNDGIDVSKVAQIFGGGGHKNAAGFSVAHGTQVSEIEE
tara:strand:+ start:6196 stop:7134 length:939 start_codon:yes stop_codon:yes gene_type:complete